jgi:hypothetical protein
MFLYLPSEWLIKAVQMEFHSHRSGSPYSHRKIYRQRGVTQTLLYEVSEKYIV